MNDNPRLTLSACTQLVPSPFPCNKKWSADRLRNYGATIDEYETLLPKHRTNSPFETTSVVKWDCTVDPYKNRKSKTPWSFTVPILSPDLTHTPIVTMSPYSLGTNTTLSATPYEMLVGRFRKTIHRLSDTRPMLTEKAFDTVKETITKLQEHANLAQDWSYTQGTTRTINPKDATEITKNCKATLDKLSQSNASIWNVVMSRETVINSQIRLKIVKTMLPETPRATIDEVITIFDEALHPAEQIGQDGTRESHNDSAQAVSAMTTQCQANLNDTSKNMEGFDYLYEQSFDPSQNQTFLPQHHSLQIDSSPDALLPLPKSSAISVPPKIAQVGRSRDRGNR